MSDEAAIGRIDMKLDSYREANLYARSIYEQFYKQAGFTFLLNAILLNAFGFIFNDIVSSDQISDGIKSLLILGVATLSIVGLVFNFGAMLAFRANWMVWFNLNRLMDEFEKENNSLRVQKQIYDKDTYEIRVYFLTLVFYGLWMLLWWFIFLKFTTFD